jgi:hypothetical protein
MLVRRIGGAWMQPDTQAYDDEDALQQLLAESPSLVVDVDEHPAVAVREFEVPEVGALDVLVVRADGELTLVEAKLERNPESRRKVVGQLVEYAGGLWGRSYEDIDKLVARDDGPSLEELASSHVEDLDAEAFRRAVGDNLDRGRFRLIFAVDQISDALRRSVEYLNTHSGHDIEVLAFELSYARMDDVEILDPQTHGEESARITSSPRTRQRWSEPELFDWVEGTDGKQARRAIQRIYDWTVEHGGEPSVGGRRRPALSGVFQAPEGPITPWTVATYDTWSELEVKFEGVRPRPIEAIEEYLESAKTFPRIKDDAANIRAAEFKKRPGVKMADLTDERIDEFLTGIERLITAEPDASPP